MDINIKLFSKAAAFLKLPAYFHSYIQVLEISLGKSHYYFLTSKTPLNSGAQIMITKNKYITNKMLASAGIPVAKSIFITQDEYLSMPLEALIKTLRFPLVAKPLADTGRGLDVLCNIKDINSLKAYLDDFYNKYQAVQIEEFYQHAKEYRVLVLKNKVLGVVERTGAHVLGDGEHSIEALMEIKNRERALLGMHLTISPMVYDKEYENCLLEQGFTLKDIPEKGQKVRLCYTANTGRGGDVYSHGRKIHAKNRKRLCQVAQTLGLDYVGLDVFCEDINKPFEEGKWLIIEANYCPDITIHEVPHQGKSVSVSKIVMRQLIWRHPFSYLSHVMLRSSLSVYFRLGFVLAVLLLMLPVMHS